MSSAIIRDISSIFTCDFQSFGPEVSALAEIRKHDEYTYLHSMNVARLSVGVGRRLKLTEEMVVDLGWAALLHDIGKIKVPINILNKLKKFTPEELAVMQSHPVQALAATAKSYPITLDRLRRLSAAFEHHQRYDLKGYPVVQKKLTLHPFSRIVAVADTFDAMTTDRIYQRRVLPDVALKIMAQGFGTIFDPIVLQAFITSMGAFPVGSVVRLSDDSLAIVFKYAANSEMDRPLVYRFQQPPAERIADLMREEFRSLKILRSEFPEDFQLNVTSLITEAEREEARHAS